MANRSHRRGFTLIELLVTVAIVGLLATVAMPVAEVTYKRSKEHELREALREIRRGIDNYKQAVDEGRIISSVLTSGYPPTLAALVEGVQDARDPDKHKIYFLRRIPRDPMSTDAGIPNDQTWGLRSYESPPDDPRPGEDVFDIHSLSQDLGLNGFAYKDW
jgi:general secretion pathway protein G